MEMSHVSLGIEFGRRITHLRISQATQQPHASAPCPLSFNKPCLGFLTLIPFLRATSDAKLSKAEASLGSSPSAAVYKGRLFIVLVLQGSILVAHGMAKVWQKNGENSIFPVNS